MGHICNYHSFPYSIHERKFFFNFQREEAIKIYDSLQVENILKVQMSSTDNKQAGLLISISRTSSG